MIKNSGVVYTTRSSSGNQDITYLSLEEIRVNVQIVDVLARVSLIQIYKNLLNTPALHCKYLSPVPAGAGVCAFSMRAADGRTVTGVAKEKEAAQDEYEEALRAGKYTGLVNYITGDVFTISIGAVPGNSIVETNLVYVMILPNDDNVDEIRFQLAMEVGERYGTPPPEFHDAVAPSPTRIEITAEIQTSGRLRKIFSPSNHSILQSRYPTDIGRPSRRRATVKFRSQSFLNRDFILTIHAEGLDSPRCIAELQRDSEGRGLNTLTMQLTLVPKLSLPPLTAQEYLFVIDNSSSMSGNRIFHAKQTLKLLIRMLPFRGTLFNIFMFNNVVSSKWSRSQSYNQTPLNDAIIYVNSIQAQGGTEIGKALKYVLESRNSDTPTALFILTDGDVHDHEAQAAVSAIKLCVAGASAQAPLRIFTLGIGSGISTATCEDIARAGNGICFFAIDTESILGKCAHLLRAAKTPFVQNISIDWGLPIEYSNSTHPNAPSSNQARIQALPAIQQVPTQIQDIHAGTRKNIFAIVTSRNPNVPKEIILRGELDNAGGEFELRVGVVVMQLADLEPQRPLIHTLAARRLIQEHEDKQAPLPALMDSFLAEEVIRKAVIIYLGEKYQLISRYTSFVAVDSWQQDRSTSTGSGNVTFQARLRSVIRRLFLGIFASRATIANQVGIIRTIPGSWPDSPPPSSLLVDDNERNEECSDSRSTETFSTLSSLEPCECRDWSEPSSPEMTPNQSWLSLHIVPSSLAPEGERQRLVHSQNASPAPPAPSKVVELLALQLFDGSFPLSYAFGQIVGTGAVDEANNLRTDDKVWATALSIAFVTKHMGQTELSRDILAKALEFLRGRTGTDAKELIQRATELLV